MTERDLSLPPGSVLVHIGPYKTGSTAIQASLAQHRDDLMSHGVLYPGPHNQQFRPSWALIGRGPRGAGQVSLDEWDDLAELVRESAASRVCLSSESLASATAAQAQQLVTDLGPDRVHVLAVVRRLGRVLPSAWQQRLQKSGDARSYEAWLHEVLAAPPAPGPGRTFWRNHGVGDLLQRWHQCLPPERITLLVADEADRTQQMRTMEALLDLPDGLLTPGARDNASFSFDRIEFYRRVLQAFADRGWDETHRRTLLQNGLLAGLRGAPPHESDLRIPPLPRWAVERVTELSEARVQEVVSSGARVLGDPDALRFQPGDGSDAPLPPTPETIRVETAALAVESLVEAAMRSEKAAGPKSVTKSRPQRRPAATVAGTSSRDLAREVARRVRRRALGRARSSGGDRQP